MIAPDLVGFGKSDKPADKHQYSYQRHVDWMASFVRALDLSGITLFCQDWGSLIGLRVAVENDDRFARIVVGNGALPTVDGRTRPPTLNAMAFLAWRAFASYSPVFPISRIVNAGCLRTLSARRAPRLRRAVCTAGVDRRCSRVPKARADLTPRSCGRAKSRSVAGAGPMAEAVPDRLQ